MDEKENKSTRQSDLWSLTATLFFALYHQTPHGFTRANYTRQHEAGGNPKLAVAQWLHSPDGLSAFQVPQMPGLLPDAQQLLSSTLRRGLAYNPNDRFRSAHEMHLQLKQIANLGMTA